MSSEPLRSETATTELTGSGPGRTACQATSTLESTRSRANRPAKRRTLPRCARPPSETFYGGYAGVFTDPDGHAWEIAHNPGFSLAGDGTLTLPDFSA